MQCPLPFRAGRGKLAIPWQFPSGPKSGPVGLGHVGADFSSYRYAEDLTTFMNPPITTGGRPLPIWPISALWTLALGPVGAVPAAQSVAGRGGDLAGGRTAHRRDLAHAGTG
jgi:hypothetical protein